MVRGGRTPWVSAPLGHPDEAEPHRSPRAKVVLEPTPFSSPLTSPFRGGGGDVGIIRSPVRATALPDSPIMAFRVAQAPAGSTV